MKVNVQSFTSCTSVEFNLADLLVFVAPTLFQDGIEKSDDSSDNYISPRQVCMIVYKC